MMRNILIIITITLLLILSGCSKKPENEASIETIDGIQYVHNIGDLTILPDGRLFVKTITSRMLADDSGNLNDP